MLKNKYTHSGTTLMEVVIASTLFMVMMGVTLSLILNIQDAAQTELDRSHLQSQVQGVVDEIVNDVRESKWRWTYVANASNGAAAPNSFFIYPTGRDQNGRFNFHTDGDITDIGLTNWQGMTLVVALPDPSANINNSGIIRYDLWKFTHFNPNIIPLVGEGISNGVEFEVDTIDDNLTALEHGNIIISESNTQIFIRNSSGTDLIIFNKNGEALPGQTTRLLMKNVTRFFINAVEDVDGQLQLPADTDNDEKYRFPFSLDLEALYVSTNVRVSLSTAVLAENKNNL